ncbi:hypothetical protein QUA54_18550 [Microcoleus sp. MOSTC5]
MLKHSCRICNIFVEVSNITDIFLGFVTLTELNIWLRMLNAFGCLMRSALISPELTEFTD